MTVQGWESPFAGGWWNVTVVEPESNPILGFGQPAASPSPHKPLTRERPKRLNLLLAEDNLPDALLIREAIKMENLPVEVFVASDGERAIDFLETAERDRDAPQPDVILLDINLPKVDGLEVLRRIREGEKFNQIPVIIITSSDSPSDRKEAAKFGAGYFRKPPTYAEFLKIGPALKDALERSGLL
jgi:CheY-like chemotaxis protein